MQVSTDLPVCPPGLAGTLCDQPLSLSPGLVAGGLPLPSPRVTPAAEVAGGCPEFPIQGNDCNPSSPFIMGTTACADRVATGVAEAANVLGYFSAARRITRCAGHGVAATDLVRSLHAMQAGSNRQIAPSAATP